MNRDPGKLAKKKKTGKKLAKLNQPEKKTGNIKKKNWQKTGNAKLARKKNWQNQNKKKLAKNWQKVQFKTRWRPNP